VVYAFRKLAEDGIKYDEDVLSTLEGIEAINTFQPLKKLVTFLRDHSIYPLRVMKPHMPTTHLSEDERLLFELVYACLSGFQSYHYAVLNLMIRAEDMAQARSVLHSIAASMKAADVKLDQMYDLDTRKDTKIDSGGHTHYTGFANDGQFLLN